MTEVEAVRIDWFMDGDLEKFRSLLSDDKLSRIDRFSHKKDYVRSLVGEAIVRTKLNRITGINPKELIIDKNKYGKPFLLNVHDIYFNISHSGEWVVSIISDQPCGIDVEKIADIDIDIAERFFAKKEYAEIERLSSDNQRNSFFEFWTIKESYIKFLGLGLSMPLNSFEIIKREGKYELDSKGKENCNIQLIDFDPLYRLAISFSDEDYRYCSNEREW